MQIRKPLLNATACLQSPSKLNVYVDENDLERLELFAAALMNTGVMCDVTFCRLVNIYNVSRDRAAFIYEVKQSKREILDCLAVKVKELTLLLKAGVYIPVCTALYLKKTNLPREVLGLYLVTNYKPLHVDW
jgi:hypothetical protein